MRNRVAVAVTTAVLSLAVLTACGSDDKPDAAACKKAIAEQIKGGENAKGNEKRPSACKGVDDKTVQRLVSEVVKEELGDLGTKAP